MTRDNGKVVDGPRGIEAYYNGTREGKHTYTRLPRTIAGDIDVAIQGKDRNGNKHFER